jgi:hypothetical protein
MAYVPDWESLAETVARVMACGYSVSEAQRDICHALRDGKLRQRYRVERVQTPNGFDVNLQAVGQLRSRFDQRDIIGQPRVPPDLIPDDIDWVNSRPKCPWLDQHRFLVRIDKIEVSTKDVIRTLCVGPSGVSSSGPSDLSSTRGPSEASLVNEAAAEPRVEAAAEPRVEAAAEPVLEAIAEPVLEAAAEPVLEAAAEPVLEAAAKPVVEAVAEPVLEAAAKPVVEAVAEPVLEAAAEPVVEAVAKPVVEAAAKPVLEAVAEPVVEAVAEPTVKAGAKKRPTIGEETRAAIALAQELEVKPQISKAKAKQFLSDMGLALDGRPFQRVWANARVRAGLPITARAGRKRKSPREN